MRLEESTSISDLVAAPQHDSERYSFSEYNSKVSIECRDPFHDAIYDWSQNLKYDFKAYFRVLEI